MISARRDILLAGIVICVNLPAQNQPLVREERSVKVNGTQEVWRLQWKSVPKPFCDDATLAPTCPCTGFAYGERGDLDLIRLRLGAETDRLNLTPLFKGSDVISRTEDEAAVQRAVRVMRFGDYNHDGLAAEFFLQTDAKPCGKRYGVVLGITKDNTRLHPFASVAHPGNPLIMRIDEWEKLRTAKGPVKIIDWLCDDHGSDEQVEFELTWSPKGIAGLRRAYACDGGRPGRLLTEEPL